jgi:serine/threonine-protein kinase
MNKLNNLDAGFALGRYELVLRIASGGMGEVWAARLKGTRGFQKVVALKFLLPELSANPSFEQMFLDEAALAARIRHPNVVQVVDLGEENEILYQVMEWVNGESLWAVMRAAAKKGGVPLEVAARIICQVCAGLHAAHELKDDEGHSIGLVHRDVTPQNILLTPEGLAKVVDFGVAKFAGRGVAQTQAGELKGKVPYMAPEHIKGRELDRRADVFSLGILFYQLVAGVHPFLGDNDQLTMVRISSATPAVPLRARVPTISEELSNVVAATLEKSPENRTKTTLDLMHDIERTVPGASMASTNDLVAAFLREVLGDQVGAREVELREALRSLDMRTSLPPEGGRLSQVPAAPAIAPASTAPPSAPASPASAASLTSPTSEGAANRFPSAMPSGLAGPVVSDEADARDAEPHPSWLRRHARAVVAAAAVGLVTVIILVSSGGPQPSPGAGEPVASPEPSPSTAPEPSSSAAPEPTPSADPSAKTAEPSSTSANNASTAPAAGAGTAPGTTGAAPRPTLTPPAGTGGPAKLGPKKREYTPGGL